MLGGQHAGLTAAILLVGCSVSPQPDQAARAAAEQGLTKALAPVQPKVEAMWYARGERSQMICGITDALPRLEAEQTNIRFVSFDGDVTLEPHLLAFDPLGKQIAGEGVAVFDRTWADNCAGWAPGANGVSRWLHQSDSPMPDTPVVNAYRDDLLSQARHR